MFAQLFVCSCAFALALGTAHARVLTMFVPLTCLCSFARFDLTGLPYYGMLGLVCQAIRRNVKT